MSTAKPAPLLDKLLNKVLVKPDPVQPEDSNDEMINITLILRESFLQSADFQCSACQKIYCREVVIPTLGMVKWTPNPHYCIQTEQELVHGS